MGLPVRQEQVGVRLAQIADHRLRRFAEDQERNSILKHEITACRAKSYRTRRLLALSSRRTSRNRQSSQKCQNDGETHPRSTAGLRAASHQDQAYVQHHDSNQRDFPVLLTSVIIITCYC